MRQPRITQVEIDGSTAPDADPFGDPGRGDLRLLVDGRRLAPGDLLPPELGFEPDTVLGERLLRIFVVLALRRPDPTRRSGWVDAAEIAQLAFGDTTGAGVSKLLEQTLAPYTRHLDQEYELPIDRLPDGVLVHYWPRRRSAPGGRSRGPYRLAPPPARLRIDRAACLRALTGRSATIEVVSVADADRAITAALASGELLAARQLLVAAVQATYLGESGASTAGDESAHRARNDARTREQQRHAADLWRRLANLEMELGLSPESLAAARRARALYTAARHPEGVAHALSIECHARGQFDDAPGALAAARAALYHLDSATRSARTGAPRAAHIGVLGQRLSHTGRVVLAERKLRLAEQTMRDAGRGDWATVWALRRAENALRARDLAGAEAMITQASEYLHGAALTVPMRVLQARATAEFLAASGRLGEAAAATRDAARIARAAGMAHALRRLQPLIARLTAHDLWPAADDLDPPATATAPHPDSTLDSDPRSPGSSPLAPWQPKSRP